MVPALLCLLGCQLLGEALVQLTRAPVPGPVLGMLLLALWLGLVARGRIPAALGQTADVLLAHLSLLFVPAGVGVMLHLQRIAAEWLAIVAALVLSTLLAIAATAIAMRAVLRRLPPPADDGDGDGDGRDVHG
ncbi:CidA/LrgA family protein [Plasticicumulans sp.]|uniref:CidA/LrgA family protein n=2 Tax=Plasticicumulans sp. TaxID=2307179 RepID=UPI00392D8C54